MTFKTFWHSKPKQTDKKSVNPGSLDSFKYKTAIETRFADFDMLGHVNNAVYFTYLEIARTKYWNNAISWNWKETGVVIAQASIDYISPIFIEDKVSIYVRTSRIGNTSFDLDYMIVKHIHGKEEICTKGKTICVAFSHSGKKAIPIPETEKEKMIAFEQL
ncbi:acyl-CoA thioester hydrolase [Pedobacter cryoconitis]|uniref:Acyl-CoA thioester hydrolase n=1 Tax=Pedobacter cryoconitis TaxID=188932 RepID=A0A7W8ZJG3_9SPHI|nr:thioesterase family protein [Pedobacter cryoconitis]MBB5634950.1 acyl-CoA thioester hydrolase [Pedobacter cryoconitis]